MVDRLSQAESAWVAVDDYIARHLLGDDTTLSATLAANAAGGLPRLRATAVQTVGAKKWDGFLLAVVGDAL